VITYSIAVDLGGSTAGPAGSIHGAMAAAADHARAGLEPALAGELAQLESLRRMVRGAAHAWNNALTAILGEARCLLEERADDPAVVRACADIEREARRCARLSRALQGRADWRPGEPGEVDLGALARGLAPTLRETVSASVDLRWDVPADAPWVRARRADAELLVLLAAQTLLRGAPGGAALRIAVGKAQERHAEVSMERSAPGPADPAPYDAWSELVDEAARTLAAHCGATWNVDVAAGRACLRFACA
jgi:signal transduction histidine kinase